MIIWNILVFVICYNTFPIINKLWYIDNVIVVLYSNYKNYNYILLPRLPRQQKHYDHLYISNSTNTWSLELFIYNIEKDLFKQTSLILTRLIISKRKPNVLKEIKSWNDQTTRVQDKGSRFLILENTDYG